MGKKGKKDEIEIVENNKELENIEKKEQSNEKNNTQTKEKQTKEAEQNKKEKSAVAVLEKNEEINEKENKEQEEKKVAQKEEQQLETNKKENIEEKTQETYKFKKASTPKKKHKFVIIIVILMILIILALLTSTIFALINSSNNKILSGISIRNTLVEGLTEEEASNMLNEKLENEKTQQIVIKIGEETFSITQEQIGVQYNVEKAIEQAYNIGRSGNIFQNNFEILGTMLEENNIDIEFTYNEKLLDQNKPNINKLLVDFIKSNIRFIESTIEELYYDESNSKCMIPITNNLVDNFELIKSNATQFLEVPQKFKNKLLYGYKINNNEMSMKYEIGNIAIIELTDIFSNNDDVIISINNLVKLRRIQKNESGIFIQPLNQLFKNEFYTNEEIKKMDIKILGKVIGIKI